MKEKEEQRVGRNKSTQIVRSYINSGKYRKKFDEITDDTELNRLLYILAKEMLFHRSGTKYEDMYWIEPKSKTIVASIVDSSCEGKIVYSNSVLQILSQYKELMTIHSHPSGLPPSIADFNSNYERKYGTGIVVGHNGKVFLYSSAEIISEQYFERKVVQFIQNGYNEAEARKRALMICTEHFDIYFKEVGEDE